MKGIYIAFNSLRVLLQLECLDFPIVEDPTFQFS